MGSGVGEAGTHRKKTDASKGKRKTQRLRATELASAAGSGDQPRKSVSHGLRSARRLAKLQEHLDRGGKEHRCTLRGLQEEEAKGGLEERKSTQMLMEGKITS